VHPTDVGIRERNPARNVIKVEDAMGYYVRNFINQYNLDQGQRETAYSILREAREEAGRYRESHKAEFAELEARQKELAASNPDKEEDLKRIKEEGRKLTERRAELEKPLTEELFARFKERLDTIPTADQRAAYEARQTALKERLAKLRQSARTATLPAGVGTRPAGTQPADEVAATPTGE
jgi:predicted nuclease with TOPRIM domain